MKISKEKE